MTRRTTITVLAAATATAPMPAQGKDQTMFQELLEVSQKEKKGVLIVMKGHTLPGVVVKITADSVELRSREYSRIVVRLDSIDAVALS